MLTTLTRTAAASLAAATAATAAGLARLDLAALPAPLTAGLRLLGGSLFGFALLLGALKLLRVPEPVVNTRGRQLLRR